MKNKLLLITACLVGACLLACNSETNAAKIEPIPKGIEVKLRPDAVGPPSPIDIEYSFGGATHIDSDVAPGTLINLGSVPAKTIIYFRVHNNYGAGTIRANILTNDCFRETGTCSGENCVAEAKYEAIEEGCPNY